MQQCIRAIITGIKTNEKKRLLQIATLGSASSSAAPRQTHFSEDINFVCCKRDGDKRAALESDSFCCADRCIPGKSGSQKAVHLSRDLTDSRTSAGGVSSGNQPATLETVQRQETRSNMDPQTTSESVLVSATSHANEMRANSWRRNTLRESNLRRNRQHRGSRGADRTVLAAGLPVTSLQPSDTRVSDDEDPQGQSRKKDSKRENGVSPRFAGHESSTSAAGSGFCAAKHNSLTSASSSSIFYG